MPVVLPRNLLFAKASRYTQVGMASSNMPDLAQIVEEVAATKTPRALKQNNKIVAVLTPVETDKTQQDNTQAIKETLALAGSWKDLDFDDMLEQLDTIRHQSKPTPPLTLDL